MTEDQLALLRKTKASWQEDGLGLRGSPTIFEPKLASALNPVQSFEVKTVDTGAMPRASKRDLRGELDSIYDGEQAGATGSSNSNIYAFQMDSAGATQILIHDGQVSSNGGSGVFPSGMGSDNFTLTVADGDQVWVEVTYDTTTLAITSATIANGAAIPDSSLGDAYFLLGYVNIASGATVPHNTQCGDINIAFIYGDFNGAPALFLLSQLDVAQPLPP